MLTAATAVKGQGAALTGRTRRAETATEPEWLAPTEAEPRAKGREVGQRVAATHTSPSWDKGFHRGRIVCPPHPPVAQPAEKSSRGGWRKGWKKAFKPKDSVLMVTKATRKKRAADA